jgi:hypothetical protein
MPLCVCSVVRSPRRRGRLGCVARAASASPVIASQWVLGWDLNENDAYSVRISDPHLQQAPRLPFGCTHDLDTGRLKALVFGTEIPDLYPEGEVASRCPIPDTGHFQVASAEEENQPRIVAVTELSVDSKTKRVPVETSTAISVGRSQQDPTTEDVHTPDHAADSSSH